MARTPNDGSFFRECRAVLAGALTVASLVTGGAGCGDAGRKPPPSAPGGAGGAGGLGGSGSPAVDPGVAWDAGSQSIDVTCGSFFMGSTRFVAARDQMTAEQLALLANLRVVDSTEACFADGFGCSIEIVQGDGTTLAIDSLEEDSTCQQTRKVVSYATFKPFADTLTCGYGKGAVVPSPSDAITPPDPRCFNGLFTTGSGDITRSIPIADVRKPLHVELDDCDQPGRIGRFSFTLFDADGTTLGTSAAPPDPGPEHTCATLTTMVPHPESVNLVVSVAGAMPVGDLWLRVFQVDPPAAGGGPGSAGGAGGMGGAPAQGDLPVWSDSSRSIDVRCSGYYDGVMRFAASRGQLSSDQLALLSAVRRAGASSSCTVDGMSCQVAITQGDGGAQAFVAAADGWCAADPGNLIAFQSLKPFLDSLACPYVRPGLSSPYTVPLDERCFDALASQSPDTTFKVSVVDVTRPLHAELDDCDQPGLAGTVSITLLDTDGTTTVASSTPPASSGPNHACATLTATAPHAGQVTIAVSGNAMSVPDWLRVFQ